MTEEPQKSRADSLISVISALFRIDPLVTLIAVVIILPIAIPLTQAILGGETAVVITFVIFIAGITILVYIPLVIVKAYLQIQKDQTDERKIAIKTESKNRILAEQNKQTRLNELVAAQISTLETKKDFILGQSYIEDRKVFLETMEQLHELLKNGGVNFVSQITFTETIQKILEDLSVVYNELELAKTSTIDGPVAIKQEHPPPLEEGSIEDLQQRLFDWKANYEALENTLADLRKKYDTITDVNMDQTEKIELKDIQIKSSKQERDELAGEVYETKAHLAELRDLIDQYRKAYGELPEPIPSTLPEPDGFDQLGEAPEKESNLVIKTIKKALAKVTPDKSVLTDAMGVLDGLKDETDETELTADDIDLPISTITQNDVDLAEDKKPLKPVFWLCPKCKRGNDLKKVRCPKCRTAKPPQTVV